MNYIVYKYTFPNGKLYFGITSRKLSARAGKHGQRYKGCPRLWAAICHYGWENVKKDIIATGLTKEEAEQMEIELIDKFQTRNKAFGYNIAIGGLVNCGFQHSEEFKHNLSIQNSGSNNPMYGKHHTKETIERMSYYAKHRDAEYNKKISESLSKEVEQIDINTGLVINIFKSVKEATLKTGITHISDVCTGKMTQAGGFKWQYVGETYECKAKPRNKKVVQIDIDTGEIIQVWDSCANAAKFLGVDRSYLGKICNKNAIYYGYKWSYIIE